MAILVGDELTRVAVRSERPDAVGSVRQDERIEETGGEFSIEASASMRSPFAAA